MTTDEAVWQRARDAGPGANHEPAPSGPPAPGRSAHIMIADAPVTPVLGMTPGQAVEILQRDLGLTLKDLQAVLETTPRNIERWIQEQAHPQTKARHQLAHLMEFRRHLGDMFTE